jgi:hypothetical protein
LNRIFEAYDLRIHGLVDLYRKLNTAIPYPDGMLVVMDTLYWGREKHYPEFYEAIPLLEQCGLKRLSQLQAAICTPGKMKDFAAHSGISVDTLRIIKHDLGLWLPQAVPLDVMEPLQKYARDILALAQLGITHQLQLLSQAQSPSLRSDLAHQAHIAPDMLSEITRLCDLYRSGRNLGHIRDQLYYEMGLDTWQKWAAASSEEIITRFADYLRQHNLESKRLVPWPREVRNGIEWARLHVSIFAVEW